MLTLIQIQTPIPNISKLIRIQTPTSRYWYGYKRRFSPCWHWYHCVSPCWYWYKYKHRFSASRFWYWYKRRFSPRRYWYECIYFQIRTPAEMRRSCMLPQWTRLTTAGPNFARTHSTQRNKIRDRYNKNTLRPFIVFYNSAAPIFTSLLRHFIEANFSKFLKSFWTIFHSLSLTS
jgi:hypothetical protein